MKYVSRTYEKNVYSVNMKIVAAYLVIIVL